LPHCLRKHLHQQKNNFQKYKERNIFNDDPSSGIFKFNNLDIKKENKPNTRRQVCEGKKSKSRQPFAGKACCTPQLQSGPRAIKIHIRL
jgi:hypothetical protein